MCPNQGSKYSNIWLKQAEDNGTLMVVILEILHTVELHSVNFGIFCQFCSFYVCRLPVALIFLAHYLQIDNDLSN